MSLEVKDILRNIRREMLNQFNGFGQCLKAYQNQYEKMDVFISQCQRLVENGWNEDIKDVDDEVYFFSSVLKLLLVDPAQNAFKDNNISVEDEKVIRYFTRLALFRLLFDAHKNYSRLENCHVWFASAKLKLDSEFNFLSNASSEWCIKFNGKTINKIEEFGAAIKEKQKNHTNYLEKLDWRHKFLLVLGLAVLFSRRFVSEEVHQKLMGFVVVLLCFAILIQQHSVYSSVVRDTALRSNVLLFNQPQQQEKINEILSNELIKKFFYVSKEEMGVLFRARDDELVTSPQRDITVCREAVKQSTIP